jgi:uncharacterized membrane protein
MEIVVHSPFSKIIDRIYNNFRSSGSAIEILEKRYAAGEISEKEFKRMKQNLTGGS